MYQTQPGSTEIALTLANVFDVSENLSSILKAAGDENKKILHTGCKILKSSEWLTYRNVCILPLFAVTASRNTVILTPKTFQIPLSIDLPENQEHHTPL